MEGSGKCKLTQFVTDHIFRHVHRNKLLAVVHGEGQPHKVWKHG